MPGAVWRGVLLIIKETQPANIGVTFKFDIHESHCFELHRYMPGKGRPGTRISGWYGFSGRFEIHGECAIILRHVDITRRGYIGAAANAVTV